MKLTLHFKRAQKEGLHDHLPLYSLTTTATSTSTTPMCNSSPSRPQETIETSSQAHESPQTLNPINQPDSDQENPYKKPEEKSNLDNQKFNENEIENEKENENEAAEEEDPLEDDQEEQDPDNPGFVLSSFRPPPSSIDVMVGSDSSDVRMRSQSSNHPKRLTGKRKKGKGMNVKKQQVIEKKLHTLLENLNPVPFIPDKTLDFSKHEKLLKRLGLWDFFHIEFDRNVRTDLIAQLIATYDPKLRCSYVNEFRIAVNRADLARAFKLPVKKEKGGNLVFDGVDLDCEALSEESIGFIEGFVSNWVLLHEDTWMMPNEVLNWTKAIKDGHPEKVDWAGLFWFMVEKELMKGEQLVDCYYASHLQYLTKSQREEAIVRVPEEVVLKEEQARVDLNVEEEVQGKVELDAEKLVLREAVELDVVMEEENGGNEVGDVRMAGVCEIQEQENDVLGGPNVELTLGQDAGEKEEEKDAGEKEEEKDAEMMDVEECKEDEEQEQEHEQGQWLLDGKNNVGEHFMQHCNVEDARGFDSLDERKEEVDELEGEEDREEEGEDGFNVGPNDDALEGDDGLTGNFLQALETTQIAFGSQGHLHDDSSVDLAADRIALHHMAAGGLSFYGNNGKREMDHEHDISHHSLNGSNKRLRIDGPWDHKPLEFGTCMEQMHQLMDRARMMYEEKDQAQEELSMNQQMLLNEVQERDSVIEHLRKSKCEEIQKRDAEMYRLQRELYLMGNLLEDYRKALMQTNKAFAEYRLRYQLPEEPIYKDAGSGGVMLTNAEIEKQRLEEEEEYRMTCSILEQNAKEAEEGYALLFGDYLNKVLFLDKRLTDLENGVKELRNLSSKPKVSEPEQKVLETSGLSSQVTEVPPEKISCGLA